MKGNTDLKGGVIASSDKAVQDNLNALSTATLTHSDIENHASYDASSIGLSGGYGGTIGKDQKGKADNVNPVPGTSLPKGDDGLQVAPPVALGASGDANSTTKSGISGGILAITDSTRQWQLTGQTAAETVADINRDTSNTGGALGPIFDKDNIEARFEIVGQFVNQIGTFVANKTSEIDKLRQTANDPNAKDANGDPMTVRSVSICWRRPLILSRPGAGQAGASDITALTAAAGGNVTGGTGQFAANAAIGYVQSLAANKVKELAVSMVRM
ncbi:hypothetical protein [Burkholderia multivorans]|uniref:hypothetical protein n=1 Tax=Burkholderia multivorans TaxID=87883 RepID=UPI0018DBE59C|nr:hypothetical protein [Burkholderia multivorans]MBH9663717.1 hypothetical protein [Burkholderia multivorans]MBU9210586.1 hypothetical protein [Burkholderia multivorans]